jgi:AbrB family looped-hinge helix DNA binding protein
MNNMKSMMNLTDGPMDIVTLGERGQIVIPASIRERLSLHAGDKIMVFTKRHDVVCLVPASSLKSLVDSLKAQLEETENNNLNKDK